ncbi:hypothetical protein EYR40_003370 [Pleurotus pulmonarius]|nr:hypothetical protein EYR40_003370 [Pleurotus pulmonarius]KAF4606097.1 hypothetical protein EYR38_000142 [Pleurotus pulmonarius]
MVWVSNQAGTSISVSITSNGAAASTFQIPAAGLESSAINLWTRGATASETATIKVGGETVTVKGVSGGDFLLIYSDTYIKFPTEQVFFG